MKIVATTIKAKDLKVGDLFSTASQLYWKHVKNNESLGEKVYIRTNKKCPKNQENEEVSLITVKLCQNIRP